MDVNEMSIVQAGEAIGIKNFLSAYDFKIVKAGLALLARERSNMKRDYVRQMYERAAQMGWVRSPNNEIPSDGSEWTEAPDGNIYIRGIGVAAAILEKEAMQQDESSKVKKPKADLSMRPTDKICITCGGTLAYEPICGGCRLGRIGFKGRYVCMEDMDHEFYVLREGIILPNQGD